MHYWHGMRTILRLRGCIGLVAALSVLLQAGALVHHRLAMAEVGAQYQAMLADLGSICQAAAGQARAGANSTPRPDLPAIPAPTDTQSGCPICLGLVAAFALVGPAPKPLETPARFAEALLHADIAAPVLPRTAHPPARGPPPAQI
jgi:hypothetical protein